MEPNKDLEMLHPSVEVREHSLAGKGLFATRLIKQGETVWQLDTREPQLTHEQKLQLSEEEQSLAFQFKDRYIICHDGSQYMNHSCGPNTWWLSDTALEARQDIQLGEEITYDYVTADIAPEWTAPWVCACGSSLCRHRISSNDYKDKRWQDRYSGHLPSWVVKAIESESLAAK